MYVTLGPWFFFFNWGYHKLQTQCIIAISNERLVLVSCSIFFWGWEYSDSHITSHVWLHWGSSGSSETDITWKLLNVQLRQNHKSWCLVSFILWSMLYSCVDWQFFFRLNKKLFCLKAPTRIHFSFACLFVLKKKCQIYSFLQLFFYFIFKY